MKAKPPLPRCGKSGKVRYPDEATAVRVAAKRMLKKGSEELREYKCPHCDGHHLTSHPASDYK